MCGVIAAAGLMDRERAQLALDQIAHRGPDGHGFWSATVGERPVLLGHRRLSIIDLSERGAQPMVSADRSWVVSYNGEIYNHEQLRRELPRHEYRGHSDTETLVEALAHWGIEETVRRLNGMYAFVAVDQRCGKLFVCRDHFGVKPIYYSVQPHGVFCASEIRALLTLANAGSPSIDEEALNAFLTLRFVPSPRTLLQRVSRLPPGHVLTVDLATLSHELRYVPVAQPSADARRMRPMTELVEEYDAVLREAVRRQLLSDVPVGVLLSGGVDSALLAAIIVRLGFSTPTFTVGFGPGHEVCELDPARETAQLLGLPNVGVRVGRDELWSVLRDAVRATEEPLGTTSVLPMWYLVRQARRDVVVALAGQGSDEPWGGYGRYKLELLRKRLPLVATLPEAAGMRLAQLDGLTDQMRRGLRAVPIDDPVRRFCAAYELFTAQERVAMGFEATSAYALTSIAYWHSIVGAWSGDSAEAMMSIDARMNLADDLLLYGDKISMSTSLEVRVPMLDYDVMRFVEGLPLHFRLSVRRSKILHRALAQRYLGARIVQRKKQGFQVPFADWSRGPWRQPIEDILLGGAASYLRRVDGTAVARLWRQHLAGRDMTRQIFALLTLGIWWQEFMEQ
jgi:asparagine synthase (glutamine-hydrolysing)